MRSRSRVSGAAACVSAALALSACAADRAGDPARTASCADEPTGRLAPPRTSGQGSIAPEPPSAARPTRRPSQVSASLRGHPLPTNQWWTSALVGPWTEPLVAGPVAVRVTEQGVAVSYRPPRVEASHVVQPFIPSVVAGGVLEEVEVGCYGAFHVVLESRMRGGGSLRATVVQGSPVVWLGFSGVSKPGLRFEGVASDLRISGAQLALTLDGRRWHAAAASGSWVRDGSAVALSNAPGRVVVALAPAPDGADRTWPEAVARAARDPVLRTTESLTYVPRRGVARQVLTAERESGARGLWALTPIQRRHAGGSGSRPSLGTYATSVGRMVVVEAGAIAVEAPARGLVPGVPALELAPRARRAVSAALRSDISRSADGGSYFGAKELARLAGIAEVAEAVGERRVRGRALARLRSGLVDWFTHSGPDDPRYFAYDSTWGGLIPVPPEFGANDYNDHHLQLGYLVRAAAVLAKADEAFARAYGSVVDLVVRDFAGSRAGVGGGGFPSERVWNPGVGHSWASGYALFADGNNQESSSEAVAAWAAVTRWGLVTGRPRLTRLGMSRYALEAAAARMYWLGEQPSVPRGYAHRVVGIVWGAKVDYATWFSPDPAAIYGIQLLPVGFGSLYRADPGAARSRMTALLAESGGRISQWSNLLAAERALFDPAGARSLLDPDLPSPEPSTGQAIARYLVETLAVTGPPEPTIAADAPFGLAMRRGARVHLLTVNPTVRARSVTFRRGRAIVARVVVPARGSRVVSVRS